MLVSRLAIREVGGQHQESRTPYFYCFCMVCAAALFSQYIVHFFQISCPSLIIIFKNTIFSFIAIILMYLSK